MFIIICKTQKYDAPSTGVVSWRKIFMVTERNDAGTESQVEVADSQVSPENTQAESVAPVAEETQDLSETVDPPIEVAPQTEPQTETQDT